MRMILIGGAAALCFAHAPAGAQATGEYAQDLGTVYAGYQRVVALKEACESAVPASRAANDRAFEKWQKQHADLIGELKRRVTAMIRAASADEKDYVRNLGKYEGAILRERQEYRDMLLGLGPAELAEHCERLPQTLGGPAGDLAKTYAAELEVVRRRE